MELLILKCGSSYIRFKDDMYYRVKLDKASVFPMDQMDRVKLHESRLIQEGATAVSIKKLVLTEEDL